MKMDWEQSTKKHIFKNFLVLQTEFLQDSREMKTANFPMSVRW